MVNGLTKAWTKGRIESKHGDGQCGGNGQGRSEGRKDMAKGA